MIPMAKTSLSTSTSFKVSGTNQRVATAQQAATLADNLAVENPGVVYNVWADNQQVYEVRSMPSNQTKTAPEEFDVSITCLCDFYGVNSEDFNIDENFSVEIYKGAHAWHVEGGNLTDENWAPQSDPDAEALYQYCVVDRERQLGASSHQAGFDTPESLAVELVLWINNTETPYNQLQAVVKNMTRKMAKGTYDRDAAVQGFMYAVESGAKDYAREFGGKWHEMFPRDIRLLAAEELRDEFEAEVDINPRNYEQHVYKKHLPEWQKRYPVDTTTGQLATTKKGDTIMTRKPPSRNRRRRFASRVERAQRRDADKRRQANYDDKEARLQRRVASLTHLLNKAEQELKSEQRPSRRASERPSAREARVAEIRERIAVARKRSERAERSELAERKRRRARTRQRIAELQRDAGDARRPRRTRKPAPPKGKRYVATYHKGDKAAGLPPFKILDKDTGKTHVLVDDE